jgi:ATP-dependent exoDNAse (exonuclease V) beta subunit
VLQMMRVNDMIKVENINSDFILEKARKDQHERVRNFYELTIPILKKYAHYCINKSYLDFNDLISRSIAKVVFIIGLTEGNGGFPDIWLEDRIFQIIQEANHDLLMEEERRLFYVAITRAKEKLFLMTEKGNESNFLKEIPDIFTVKTSMSIKSVIEKIPTCGKCFSQLERLWIVCPYCGEKVSEKAN